MGVVDSAVKFWREGFPSADLIKNVYYQYGGGGGRVPSPFPNGTNVMDRVRAPITSELPYKESEGGSVTRSPPRWRKEKKIVVLMGDMVGMYSYTEALPWKSFWELF